jgi:hypothetical protein
MHHLPPAHHDPRRARLRTAIEVLEKRIRRAEEHGLDRDTALALQHALEVVADNVDENMSVAGFACAECSVHLGPREIWVCTRCWARLEGLTALEPD